MTIRTQSPAMLKSFQMRIANIMPRAIIARLLGSSFLGKRDYYESFGWPKQITPDLIWGRYERGGIAKRIAHAYPDACWSRPPAIYVADDTEWNIAWDDFVQKHNIWQTLHRADILASLGRYAIVVIGPSGGNLNSPRREGGDIPYLRAFPEANAPVASHDTSQSSPTFGKPLTYRLRFTGDFTTYLPSHTGFGTVRDIPQLTDGQLTGELGSLSATEVHRSNVLHIAADALENDVYGRSIFLSVWNHLIDLDKVVGASSESYWLNAYRGLHANLDPELDLTPEDEAGLSDEIDDYVHGFRRFIRTRGVKVESLGADVADPTGAFNVLLNLIASSTGIPKRILMGAEAGQLASTQDKANWAERLKERRALHCEPLFLRPLLKFLIDNKIMPEPKGQIQILWPDAHQQSPLERGQTSAQTARTMANIVKALKDIPELMTLEEARLLIGLSTDQQVMMATPSDINPGLERGDRPYNRYWKPPAEATQSASQQEAPDEEMPPEEA